MIIILYYYYIIINYYLFYYIIIIYYLFLFIYYYNYLLYYFNNFKRVLSILFMYPLFSFFVFQKFYGGIIFNFTLEIHVPLSKGFYIMLNNIILFIFHLKYYYYKYNFI